ncbi:MAG: nucleotidyltransferase family protein, partial [Oscillospiraceae bacterium]|nr:nucleotidyltransferase family protein [Oscillospiraceae bacterium]
MTQYFITDKLLPIIRSAFDNGSSQIELSPEDCKSLLNFGRKQSVTPLIWKGLDNLSYPYEQINQFDKARMKDMRDFIVRDQMYSIICSALDNGNIDYVPLKGSVIKDLYPEPWMRTSCACATTNGVISRDFSRT